MFTSEQLQEIKKTSLARVICDNADHITQITTDVFVVPKLQLWKQCEQLPNINLTKWQNSLIPVKNCKSDNQQDFDIPLELLNQLQNG